MSRGKSFLILLLIVLVTALAGAFVYPVPSAERAYNFLPWRLGLDLVGGSQLIYEVDMSQVDSADRDGVMAGLRDVIERRVNLFGVSEPNVVTSRSGDSYRLLVELAGVKDVSEAILQIGQTPFLYFAEVQEFSLADLGLSGEGLEELQLESDGVIEQYVQTELTGRYVQRAQLDYARGGTGQPILSRPIILLQFNKEGAELFEQLTERNIGKPLAVFLDGQVISEPIVQDKISGGSAQITGQFTIEEARQLVERFNAGALPAPITLINQQTVGAALGTDSLQKMILAGAWGTGAVLLFMVLYYGGLGVSASLALLMYVILTLAAFKLLTVTMTLAGIAGFVLSIGMAVDANILIFERMKEELKKGASRASAVEEGFRRAWTSIRDSNLTTILTAVILFYFTSSFVKGFALTLMLGVLMSMFTAITVTRTLLRAFSKQ